MSKAHTSPTPVFNILLIVSASVETPGKNSPDDYLVYEYAGRDASAPLLLRDLKALGSPTTLDSVQEALVRFYREDLQESPPSDLTRQLRFDVSNQKGCYVAFARNCGCPVAVWEEDLEHGVQARLFADHIQQGLIIQHVPGRLVPALSASGLHCPHNQGNPGLWDQPIETETASLAALRLNSDNGSIQGNRLGLMALIDALQRALAEGASELNTFDDEGAPVTLFVCQENQ